MGKSHNDKIADVLNKTAEIQEDKDLNPHDTVGFSVYGYIQSALIYVAELKKDRLYITLAMELLVEGIKVRLERPFMGRSNLTQEVVIPWDDLRKSSHNPLIATLDALIPPKSAAPNR